MSRGITFILIAILGIMLIVPNILLVNNEIENKIVKYNLNLSSKILINSVDKEIFNIKDISEGYNKDKEEMDDFDIEIDKSRLINEFYSMLERNTINKLRFEKTQENIIANILVFNDRFYICDNKRKWSPPYYFTYLKNDTLYYLNSKDDKAYYYLNNSKIDIDISNIGLTNQSKNSIIIDKLNKKVNYLTQNERKGFGINIANCENENQNFNVLDGLTFFSIYSEYNTSNIMNYFLKYKNDQIAGYTLVCIHSNSCKR